MLSRGVARKRSQRILSRRVARKRRQRILSHGVARKRRQRILSVLAVLSVALGLALVMGALAAELFVQLSAL